MLSLQDISTSSDPNVDLESYSLVKKDSSWAAMEFARFEWLFGLEHHGFPFESEHNVVTVSKDIGTLIRENVLRIAPMKVVIEKGLDIIQHNRNATPSERRGLQEFGEGPWEYVLFPGRYCPRMNEPEWLPPLFYRSPNGEMLPLEFDHQNFAAFPRITSMIHPAIAILLVILYPCQHHVPKTLWDEVVQPFLRIRCTWPFGWNAASQFASKMASSSTKRKRSHSIPSCDVDHETASSSTGTYASDIPSSDDEEESLRPLGDDKEEDYFEFDVESWAWKVIPPRRCRIIIFDECRKDRMLRKYAQEPALRPDQVDDCLKQEDEKRNTLAGPLECRPSKKRPRQS